MKVINIEVATFQESPGDILPSLLIKKKVFCLLPISLVGMSTDAIALKIERPIYERMFDVIDIRLYCEGWHEECIK